MNKKLVFLATSRYSINTNDFYMFYRRTSHKIVAILYHYSVGYKPWWMRNYLIDPARNKYYDPFDFNNYRFIPWYDADSACRILDNIDFDYICMGNGSGNDQKAIIEHVGLERCLFSEYGWLPWSQNFYISLNGCGYSSEITKMDEANLSKQKIYNKHIDRLKHEFKNGTNVKEKDFIYLPLQKDVNDFKFKSSPFNTNEEFLDFVHEIVPPKTKIFVKPHPLYPKTYDFSKYGRFIDISPQNYSKASIYQSMSAMVCINSTSIIEAILFGGTVFAYGHDIFCNKDLVNFRIMTANEFENLVDQKPNQKLGQKFISLLLDRQVERRRCLRNDLNYIRSHYWNRILFNEVFS